MQWGTLSPKCHAFAPDAAASGPMQILGIDRTNR